VNSEKCLCGLQFVARAGALAVLKVTPKYIRLAKMELDKQKRASMQRREKKDRE